MAVCAAGILFSTTAVDVFTLHVEGLTGALLGEDASVSLSVAGMAGMVGTITSQGPPPLMYMLQVGFIITTMATPLVWLMCCTVLWTIPLSRRALHRWSVAAEVCYAWAMLDVFAVMVIASLLELDQFAQFIVQGEVDGINAIMQQYSEFHPYLPGQFVTFGVTPTLEAGYWLMTAFVFLSNPVGLFVMHAASITLDAPVAGGAQDTTSDPSASCPSDGSDEAPLALPPTLPPHRDGSSLCSSRPSELASRPSEMDRCSHDSLVLDGPLGRARITSSHTGSLEAPLLTQ
uniref:Uncharacterized protein n=1 Tax=Haptolina ericina TaxID=156174 RepID=A0A7S3BEG8_9EUKA